LTGFKVWRDVKLHAGKILIPGVVSHATDLVGQENIIAGSKCGVGGRVHPQIA